MSAEVDGAAGAVLLADGPVLLEGGGTLDGRLVGACVGALDVGRAVGGDGAELRYAGRAGVEAAVRFDLYRLVLGCCHCTINGIKRTI